MKKPPHPNGLKNLMPPWPKGKSGNPAGRLPGRSITERYIHFLEQHASEAIRVKLKLAPGATLGDVGALMQVRKFMAGRTDAAKEIADRVQGRAMQQIELTGEQGGPIDLTISPDESLENLIRATELVRISAREHARKARICPRPRKVHRRKRAKSHGAKLRPVRQRRVAPAVAAG